MTARFSFLHYAENMLSCNFKSLLFRTSPLSTSRPVILGFPRFGLLLTCLCNDNRFLKNLLASILHGIIDQFGHCLWICNGLQIFSEIRAQEVTRCIVDFCGTVPSSPEGMIRRYCTACGIMVLMHKETSWVIRLICDDEEYFKPKKHKKMRTQRV